MADLRGIEADFATWRPVQGRKVLQLVFEVPIEQTQHVLDMLGIPQSGGSKWCAIALLQNGSNAGERSNSRVGKKPSGSGEFSEKSEENEHSSTPSRTIASSAGSGTSGAQESEANGHPKKPWSEYPRSQQAAILCGDPDFQRYFDARDDKHCATKMREHWGIASRKEFDHPARWGQWDEFVALYQLSRQRLPGSQK